MLKVAVVTQVKDEPVFLPMWIRHYGGHFGKANLYVIDDGTADGSTDDLKIGAVLKRDVRPFDELERAVEVSAFLGDLLHFYDWVIYTDVDELLVVDPAFKLGFKDYLAKVPGNHLNAIGINVLHDFHTEPSLGADKPLFAQRKFGSFQRIYCKQLIHRQSVVFQIGFHNTNRNRNYAPGLYLMHLAFVDREATRQRWLVRNKINWSENALQKGHSIQFRLPVDSFVAERFYQTPEAFRAAAPEEQFGDAIIAAIKALEAEREPKDMGNTVALQERLPMLTFPGRFRDAVKPVTAPFDQVELAAQAPHEFPDTFDVEQIYRAAVARVRTPA